MGHKVNELQFELPHIRLAARQYGQAQGLPVLALHGWLDNAMSFERLAPKLRGLNIIALDLPGHGLSGHFPGAANYSLWDYLEDIVRVSEALGWSRFSLLGHSLGAILSTLLAAALPERVERLALIDGLVPYTAEPESAPAHLAQALKARLAFDGDKKPLYQDREQAIAARMKGMVAVSREAATLLAARGLRDVDGGYTWRSDKRLTLPSLLRLTQAHAEHFVQALQCPVSLVLAEQGHMANAAPLQTLLVQQRLIEVNRINGGHHLHLNDETGAEQVADCFNRFFQPA